MGILFNHSPPLTEKNLPDQTGKVFIITGSSAGVGKALAEILYQHNAKVYIATRNETKSLTVIKEIEEKHPDSRGDLVFLKLDLGDLRGIKASAQDFLGKEVKLDCLWLNAGIMSPPQGIKTPQGHDMQLGTNCLGHFLFAKLLTPILITTAKTAPSNSVRVIWVASSGVNFLAPKGAVDMENLTYSKYEQSPLKKYGVSKGGNFLQGAEYARRFSKDGIVSLSVDPGNLGTDLFVNMPAWQRFLGKFIVHEPIWGAYTELFAGLSDTLTTKNGGAFLEPWGKIGTVRKDIQLAIKSKAEGGGNAEAFWEWNEKETAAFL